MVKDSIGRRRFIKKLLGAITAVLAIGSAGAGALWWWSGRSREALFRKFARLRELSLNQPKLVSVPESSASTGPTAPQISVWLVRRSEDAVDAYSIICPHAGGRLRCADGEFVCPKHGARFDLQGHRLKTGTNDRPNPAPRDMDRLPVQCVIDGGDGPAVEVKYQQFLTGTPKQLPVP
jgi:nitrite reductase/ring-hydroxylating ferredoxin subunit